MRTLFIAVLGGLLVSGCSGAEPAVEPNGNEASVAGLETRVLSAAEAVTSEEEWGTGVTYFEGETEGVQDLLSGTATIKPGLEIHPPHRHHEEEFLMVLEGTGEWTVGERSFAASAGDMLYAGSWDLHGIRNTGGEPLRFVFWKWHSKGVPVPQDPAG